MPDDEGSADEQLPGEAPSQRRLVRTEEERVGRIGIALLHDLQREQKYVVKMKRRINSLVLFEDLQPGAVIPGANAGQFLPHLVQAMSKPEATDPPEVQLLFERRDTILRLRAELDLARSLYEASHGLGLPPDKLFEKRESLLRSIAKLEAMISDERRQMDQKFNALRDLFERRYASNVKMLCDMRRTTIAAQHSKAVLQVHRERIAMDERTRLPSKSGAIDVAKLLEQVEGG